VSAIDREGQPFDDPVARKALHDAIGDGIARGASEASPGGRASGGGPPSRRRRSGELGRSLGGGQAPRALIEVDELDLHINDPEFADAAARKLIQLMKER
jgi:uncharacterized protein (UPF0261 family)